MTLNRTDVTMAKKKSTKQKRQAAPGSPLAKELRAAIAKAKQQTARERERLERTMASLQKQRSDIDARIAAVRDQIDGLQDGIAGALAEAARSAGIAFGAGGERAKKRRTKKAGRRRGSGKSAERERDLLVAHLKKSKAKVRSEDLKKATGVTRNVSVLLSGVKGVRSSGEKRAKVYWLVQ